MGDDNNRFKPAPEALSRARNKRVLDEQLEEALANPALDQAIAKIAPKLKPGEDPMFYDISRRLSSPSLTPAPREVTREEDVAVPKGAASAEPLVEEPTDSPWAQAVPEAIDRTALPSAHVPGVAPTSSLPRNREPLHSAPSATQGGLPPRVKTALAVFAVLLPMTLALLAGHNPAAPTGAPKPVRSVEEAAAPRPPPTLGFRERDRRLFFGGRAGRGWRPRAAVSTDSRRSRRTLTAATRAASPTAHARGWASRGAAQLGYGVPGGATGNRFEHVSVCCAARADQQGCPRNLLAGQLPPDELDMYAHSLKNLGRGLVLVSTLAVSSTALSQATLQGADLSQQADEHFLKAKGLMKAGNMRAGHEEYMAAWALKKTYDTATNLGTVELLLGMPRDAAEHLAFAVRNYAVTGVTPDKVEKMKQAFAQARAQVGGVTIRVNLERADIFVDGRSVGRSPLEDEVFLDPGSRVIEARLPNYPPARATITAEKGSSETVTLTLSAPVAPPPSGTAPVAPPPAPGPNKGVLVTGTAVAGVGLVLGAALAGVANSKASSERSQQTSLMTAGAPVTCGVGTQASPACAQLADTVNEKRNLSNASFWGFVGGGTVGAATLIYWLATPKASASPAKPDVRVLPAAGPQGGGVEIRGTW